MQYAKIFIYHTLFPHNLRILAGFDVHRILRVANRISATFVER